MNSKVLTREKVKELGWQKLSLITASMIESKGFLVIDDYAFSDIDSNISEVEIPDSVIYLSKDSLYGLLNVKCNKDILPTRITNLTINAYSEDGLIYADDQKRILIDCYKDKKDIVVPKTVQKISSKAFKGKSITSIVLPDDINIIPQGAFMNCRCLKSVVLPKNCTKICSSAFKNCMDLKSINIPNNVNSIGPDAFLSCISLETVILNNKLKTIKSYAFANCNISNIVLPNSIKTIESNAFRDCKNLTSIIIPNSITRIAHSLFMHCRSLTSIIIPNRVTSIGDYAFSGCSGLTSVTIPNSVTSIGLSAFEHCLNLTSVTIPNSVTEIGHLAFFNCSSLKKVILSKNLKYLPGNLFSQCIALSRDIKYDDKNRVIAYKGFLPNMTCRGFQYEEGKTYKTNEDVKLCQNGFHACLNPLDVLNYYNGPNMEMHEVFLDNIIESCGDKVVTNGITIGRKLTIKDINKIISAC